MPLLTVISVIIIRMIPAFTNLSMSLQNIRYMNFSFNDISEELKEDFKSKNNPDTTIKNFKNISDIQSLSITGLNFCYENNKDLIKI